MLRSSPALAGAASRERQHVLCETDSATLVVMAVAPLAVAAEAEFVGRHSGKDEAAAVIIVDRLAWAPAVVAKMLAESSDAATSAKACTLPGSASEAVSAVTGPVSFAGVL